MSRARVVRRGRIGAVALGGALVAMVPMGARAWSDGADFERAAIEGGGGGRHFTGSPADGYTCAVCHGDAPTAPPRLEGLPAEGYAPGTTYALTADWGPDARRAGLALELVDARGAAVGTLALRGDGDEDERCRDDGTGATPRAARLVTPAAGESPRAVLVVDGCGASATRWSWTAPARAQGPVFVEASFVRANGTGGPDGDATAHLEVQVPPAQVAPEVRAVGGGCAAAGGSPWPSRRVPAAFGAALLVLVARARSRRRWVRITQRVD